MHHICYNDKNHTRKGVIGMLADKKSFDRVEEVLRNNGTIENFEKENGELRGRMMITLGELPENLKADLPLNKTDFVFIATFDFFDTAIGIAVDTVNRAPKGDAFYIKQTESAAEPPMEWVTYFINTLSEIIRPDGSFGVPILVFMSEESGFTVVPTPPEKEPEIKIE